MGERRWTDEQLSAIDTRDRTLLVSAAAGSGKTATLTERIIRSLTDAKSPVDIDSLLVVTFTNAAAAELREKLSSALEAAVRRAPGDKRLLRQLFMLPAARIRTIDSFCAEVLRANCDRVGVPPSYRIADTAECELLSAAIADGLIESVYRGELPEIASPEEFEELADCLTDSKRTEELSDVFRFVRARCDSSELGAESLLPLVEIYNPESFTTAGESRYGSYILERTREMASHYKNAYMHYEREFSCGSESERKYLDVISSDTSLLRAAEAAKTWSDMRDVLVGFELARKPAVRKDKTERMERFSALRDMMKDELTEYSAYYSYTDGDMRTLFFGLHRLLSVLYRFTAKFDAVFSEEKRRKGALSYADVERYAYRCLVENGEPTDIAKNLREQFSAIYIDEYQDVNSLQNSIFEAISRSDNRFMVGDIKQSIYGFREARPEIFAEMKSSFPSLEESFPGGGASVFMSKNFRCDRAIVDFVNSVFDKAFSLMGESIGYNEGDRLEYAKLHDTEPEYRFPEICMLDRPKRGDDGQTEPVSGPDAVAARIEELLCDGVLDSGERIAPSDIAVILRNASGKDTLYAEALERRGIPVKISGERDFFLSSEVLLALSLLNSIDNPRRDIYLAALMCSPLFGFSADELYIIRRGGEGETLYESLASYCAAHPEYERGGRFIERLSYYRAISEGVGVDVLIYKLYHETGLLALAAKSGGKDNLMLLYDYSRSYEAGAFCGLYNFISFINNILDKKTSFDDKRESESANAVKIVTAHASKGLEYPIVFFAEAGSRFTNRDKANRLVFAENFGISLRLRTPSGLALVNNPVQDIINHYVYRKLYEEELRVLYVALTRAREQLYVIGTAPIEDRERYIDKLKVLRENLSPYSVRGLSSSLEVMLTLSGVSPSLPEIFADVDYLSVKPLPKYAEQSAKPTEKELGELAHELAYRFSFKYPSGHLTSLPEKMSVSRTSPTVLDGTEGEQYFPERREERRLPTFAEGAGAAESARRGIATHYFLQFCDLENLAEFGAKSELLRLTEKGFISKKDSERVRLDEIELFRASGLFSDMRRAKRLYREFRFNVRLPASIFTEDDERRRAYKDETVLVQGVIDCILEYPDGSLGLFDYKTDRLTREELSERALAEKKLRDSHKLQLSYYAMAVERIFGKCPSRVAIYSLPLGDTVSCNS